MPLLLAAITRDDIATYVNALFIVYIILIFCRILMSYLPRVPYSVPLRAVMDFISETTDPYLSIFRRFIPTVGGGGMAFDLSPIVATFVLFILQGILVALIAG
jgi:YggT family protein